MLRSGRTPTKFEDIVEAIQTAVSEQSASFTGTFQGEIRNLRTELKSDISKGSSTLRSELSALSISLNVLKEQTKENDIKLKQCILASNTLQKEQKKPHPIY